ncbi:MAG TPA: histidine kinase [Pseudonocardia sp.]|nr:histidine kinase [Pseudonocardia sp.]
MTLEPAHCAGDAPRTPLERGTDGLSRARRSERDQWLHRRRLERQLHDGAALRISALALQLGLVRHQVLDGEPGVDAAIDGLQDELHAALQELRDVAAQIYPPLLDEAGLGPALGEAVDRLGVAVRVDVADGRFGPAAEGVAYFAVTGCLEARGAGGDEVRVAGRREGEVLVLAVDGVDERLAEPAFDQVLCLGGTVEVAGGRGAGTITARIPCE